MSAGGTYLGCTRSLRYVTAIPAVPLNGGLFREHLVVRQVLGELPVPLFMEFLDLRYLFEGNRDLGEALLPGYGGEVRIQGRPFEVLPGGAASRLLFVSAMTPAG